MQAKGRMDEATGLIRLIAAELFRKRQRIGPAVIIHVTEHRHLDDIATALLLGWQRREFAPGLEMEAEFHIALRG